MRTVAVVVHGLIVTQFSLV